MNLCLVHMSSQVNFLIVKIGLFTEPSVETCALGAHRDGSFEHPQHKFWLKNK